LAPRLGVEKQSPSEAVRLAEGNLSYGMGKLAVNEGKLTLCL